MSTGLDPHELHAHGVGFIVSGALLTPSGGDWVSLVWMGSHLTGTIIVSYSEGAAWLDPSRLWSAQLTTYENGVPTVYRENAATLTEAINRLEVSQDMRGAA